MTRPAISPRKRPTAAARREARAALKAKTEAALRGAFGDRAQIAIEDGYHDYIRVLIASPLFEGTPEHLRQARIHAALNAGLSAAEHALITMTLGYAPDEPEYAWALRELTERASLSCGAPTAAQHGPRPAQRDAAETPPRRRGHAGGGCSG